MESTKKNPFLRYVAYSIVILTFAASMIFPLIFTLTNTYAAPTASYAIQISANGDLAPPTIGSTYWRVNIALEEEFPMPSLLLSSLMLVANVPKDYAMFIPINGLAAIIYFVLTRRVVCEGGDEKGYGLLFSALSYAYLVSTRIAVNSIGRATLGVVLLTYFLFSYIMYLRVNFAGGNKQSWIFVLALFTLVIGYTYYTSSLAIVLCTGFMFVLLPLLSIKLPLKMVWPALPIALLSVALLFYGPFIYAVTSMAGALSLVSFAKNLVQYLEATLRIDVASEASLLVTGAIRFDLFTRITAIWFSYGLRLASAVAVIYVLVAYRPRRSTHAGTPRLAWLFSLAVFLLNLAELGYLFVNPTGPTRLLFIYGLTLLFLVLSNFIVGKNSSSTYRATNRKRFSTKRVLLAFSLIIVILGSLGSVSYSWNYSAAKPFAYQSVEPLSDFLLSHSSSQNRVVVAGDADYVANIFFIASLHNNFYGVTPLPLGRDALVLYQSQIQGQKGQFIDNMHKRGVGFLLIVEDSRPVWGDELGYAYTIQNITALRLSLIYSDGQSQLYTIG